MGTSEVYTFTCLSPAHATQVITYTLWKGPNNTMFTLGSFLVGYADKAEAAIAREKEMRAALILN